MTEYPSLDYPTSTAHINVGGITFQDGISPVYFDELRALTIISAMGSSDPERDVAGLQAVRYEKGGTLHDYLIQRGYPPTVGGFQVSGIIAVRAARQVTEERVFLHELQHYIDGINGMNVEAAYHANVMKQRTSFQRSFTPAGVKSWLQYRSHPLERRARAAEHNPRFAGVLLHV